MKIRELGRGDLTALTEFVTEAYNDYPLATWFDEEPSAGEVERIFYNKLRGIEMRELVDIVTEDNGTIAGECEVARMGFDSGVVGILVRHGYRRRSVGREMLTKAIDKAVGIGMTKLSAEVDEKNADAFKFFVRNGFVPIGYRNIERMGKVHRIIILRHSAG